MFSIYMYQYLKFFQTYNGGRFHTGDPVTEETNAVNLVGDVFLPALVS